jgi:hypothetical protein
MMVGCLRRKDTARAAAGRTNPSVVPQAKPRGKLLGPQKKCEHDESIHLPRFVTCHHPTAPNEPFTREEGVISLSQGSQLARYNEKWG